MSRIRRSSASNLPKSFFSAYHFERQSLLTAIRSPIGLVFCPISVVRQDDFDVAIPLQDGPGRAAPAFSPDGKWIAFLETDPKGEEEEKADKERRDARVVD